MQIGMIGLGKMGGNMVRRLLQGGHQVVVTDRSSAAVDGLAAEGATPSTGLADLVSTLSAPRAVWVMVPSGAPTQETLSELAGLLSAGDVLVDGGNSNFNDSMRRHKEMATKGIRFVDAGTSGGIWGLKVGYCLMVGGDREAIDLLAPALTTLAPPDGWLHCGPAGAGHYVKMVHNGIEYAMMQAYAEGFELFKESGFGLDNAKISRLWMQGSVVRSWLLDLAADALAKDAEFKDLAPVVADSGEGRWTVIDSIERAVPTPVITLALQMRFRSRQENSYAGRFLNALRNQFGGHQVIKK